MAKEFIAINNGTGKIDLSMYPTARQVKPIAIHLKEDGDINNQPSFCIVSTTSAYNNLSVVYGQISLKMLNEALNNLGYQIIKV